MENAEIHMKMDNVEFFRAPRDAIQHHQVMRKGIHVSRIETQHAPARGSDLACVCESPLANRVTS